MAEEGNAPRFVPGGKDRSMRIDLEYPVEFGGNVYNALTIRRLTQGEVAAWMSEISAKAQDGGSLSWPVLRDEFDLPIPQGLTDALDADDFDVINKAVLDFLPRRFRGALASASGQQPGGITD